MARQGSTDHSASFRFSLSLGNTSWTLRSQRSTVTHCGSYGYEVGHLPLCLGGVIFLQVTPEDRTASAFVIVCLPRRTCHEKRDR